MAQLRAEKEQRERDFDEGFQLVEDLTYEAHDFKGTIVDVEARQDRLQALVPQADRAFELLQHHPAAYARAQPLLNKATIFITLGQHASALAALRQDDDIFVKADAAKAEGLTSEDDHRFWVQVVNIMEYTYLASN